MADHPPTHQTHITGDPQGPVYTGPVDHMLIFEGYASIF
jgi:hypothetical protein